MGDSAFEDRRDAGRRLGLALAELDPSAPVVYALPRGGVPVGFEVATVLGCPLDVLIVRKVGVPSQPELAMGALGEGDVVIRNEGVIRAAGVSERAFAEVADREAEELVRRSAIYRAGRPPVDPSGRTAIVVDDGVATGSTARAALQVLAERHAAAVWLAIPVAPIESVESMREVSDRVVVLSTPRGFEAVGRWYRDFTQITDAQVEDLLARSRLA